MTNSTSTTSTTAALASHAAVISTHRPSLWRAGAAAGAVAAVATTSVVAAARAAGVSVAVAGEAIPLAGFAQMTLIATVIGVVIAKVLSRRARQPRRSFTITTAALTCVSLVPDVVVDATIGSKLTLIATHLVAAAIVVPSLAARLAR